MRFDSVVFADSASEAALSCYARLRAERDSGRKTLLIALVDATGADAITTRGLGTVRRFEEVEPENEGVGPDQPWRERISVTVRRVAPKHVMAPLGLLGAPQFIDYFQTLRAALSVDKGRDLLFFEERPQSLVPEAILLRLSAMGARLPPATQLHASRRYLPFALRLTTGLGVPPIFGGLRERMRLCGSLKTAFQEASDWEAQRALGPKLQPVIEPFREDDLPEFLALAAELGQASWFGSVKTFRKRLVRHAAGAGSRSLIERTWLSLPNPEGSDPTTGELY